MVPLELKQKIYRKEIPEFLVFVDHDPYQVYLYKSQIANALGLPTNYYGDLEEAYIDASMIISEKCLYVIQIDASKGITDKQSRFMCALKDMKVNAIVVLENFNKSKIVSLLGLKDSVVTFQKMSFNELFEYAQKICAVNKTIIPQEELTALIEKSNRDFGVVVNTLEQMCILQNSGIDLSGFEICDYREGDIFVFVDQILARNKSAWSYLSIIKDSPSVVAFNLYRKAREKLIATNSRYYMDILDVCDDVFNGIADGSIKESYAMKYMLYRIIEQD